MDPILEIIDAALRRKGLSDSAASKLAVGHSSLIKNMRIPRDGEKRYNLPALQKLSEVTTELLKDNAKQKELGQNMTQFANKDAALSLAHVILAVAKKDS